MYGVIAGLFSFDSPEDYGSMIARVGGGFIDQIGPLIGCVSSGSEAGNYRDIGFCTSNFLTIVFDTKL